MLPGAISTVTASGTGTGFLPIRLIRSQSPDVGDDLATDSLGAGFVAGHDASGGADDCGAGAALNPRHALVVDVTAPAGTRDPLDPDDHRTAILGVLEGHLDRLANGCRL